MFDTFCVAGIDAPSEEHNTSRGKLYAEARFGDGTNEQKISIGYKRYCGTYRATRKIEFGSTNKKTGFEL